MKLSLYRTNQTETTLLFQADEEGVENQVVNLYPKLSFEEFEGFGGAITDAAGYVYAQMDKEKKAELLNQYFSSDKMNYQMVRIHMDSCDFSTEMYEAVSDENDRELKSFDFSRTEKYILPMLEDAQRTAGHPLELMLSPWSPPAYMKTNTSRKNGGFLKKEYYGIWAEYICLYIQKFTERGFLVKRISLQNEPKAVQMWDSCIYTAEEEKEFLQYYMYPALERYGFLDVQIFIWDHNKERVYERTVAILDAETEKMVSGVAFHWYSGDHFENLEYVRKCYPNLKLIISESCIEFSKFDALDEKGNAERLSHEIIGDLNHGMTAFYDWNLLLDQNGGPNHVGNFCLAPYLYDLEKKELKPQLIQKHFYQFAHYIKRGAVRIGYSRYSDELDVTAFRNPDETVVVVLLNRTGEDRKVFLRLDEQIAEFSVPAKEIVTGIIEE